MKWCLVCGRDFKEANVKCGHCGKELDPTDFMCLNYDEAHGHFCQPFCAQEWAREHVLAEEAQAEE